MSPSKPTVTKPQRPSANYSTAEETVGLLAASPSAQAACPVEAESDSPPRRQTLPQPRSVIGIMGGMDPVKANAFGQKLIEHKQDAIGDQAHARVLLDQAADIPDRTAAIRDGGSSHVKNLQASLQRLDRGGADIVAVTCSTAHHFFDDMQGVIDKFGLKLELLHTVDATMAELEKQAPNAKKIGLLTASGALDAKIYEQRSAQIGCTRKWISLDPGALQHRGTADIYQGVMASNNELNEGQLLIAARELAHQGVDAILFDCTEIPSLLKNANIRNEAGEVVLLINTLDALAEQALNRAETKQSRLTTSRGCFDVVAEGLTSFVLSASTLINGTPERPRRIGVIGGMGPAAAMQFSTYMVQFNEGAAIDQQHVSMLLDQATDIPDRTKAILKGGPNPTREIVASLNRLVNAGADEIVMTCNTAHYFFPQLQEEIARNRFGTNPIHIVDATMKLLDEQAPHAKNIGLLATTGTLDTRIYQDHAGERTWKLPSKETQENCVMHGIYDGVKVGNNQLGREQLLTAARELVRDGADAILLACTEIPLVLQNGDIRNSAGDAVPLIDTLEALAREAIARSRIPVPATPGLVQQICQWLQLDPATVPANAIA